LVFAVFAAAYVLSQFFRHANAVLSANIARELTLPAERMGLMTSLFTSRLPSLRYLSAAASTVSARVS